MIFSIFGHSFIYYKIKKFNHINSLCVDFMDRGKYFLKNEKHFFDEFEFKNGYVIKNAKVDYGVFGTPKYDEDGNIVNAILFCHPFQGDYSSISDFSYLIGENKVFNKDDYFFISITSLGCPKSCSPSTSGLKHDFPNYVIDDLVNFQRKLLKEKFPNIKKFKGIIGYSLGGYIALGWSINYPDEMDFVIHYNSSYKSQGYRYIYSHLSNRIIESTQLYAIDLYDESMSQGLILVSQLHYLMSFSKHYINKLSIEEINMSIEDVTDEILFYDLFDIKYANDFMLSTNLEDGLDKIKCNLLVIGVNSNNYYIPEYDSIPIHESVEGSQYIFLDTGENPNHLDYIPKIEKDIEKFINSV